MPSPLENLCGPGRTLRQETTDEREFIGLLRSDLVRLCNAENPALTLEGRFNLAYNPAHALGLAAQRRMGYRPGNRCIVSLALSHTLGLGPEVWRVLAKCHDVRNLGEYEGDPNADERLVVDLIVATRRVADQIKGFGP